MFKLSELPDDIVRIGNLEDLENLLVATDKPLIVIAGAAWCNDTTRLLRKVLPGINEKYRGQVTFAVVLIEGEERGKKINQAVEKTFSIERYPTILAFRSEILKKIKSSEGAEDKQADDMEELIRSILLPGA